MKPLTINQVQRLIFKSLFLFNACDPLKENQRVTTKESERMRFFPALGESIFVKYLDALDS